MRSIRTLALSGLLALAPAFAGTAFAADGGVYPRVIESGENKDIDYGPGTRGNVFGGGAAIVTHNDGQTVSVTYLDDRFVQRRTDGLVPVTVGSGEDSGVAYVAPGAPTRPSLAALLRRLGG